MTPIPFVVLAYVLGATPTSLWVGKGIFGVDLREAGSGNLGATNTFRVLGWTAGLPVVTVDILKGFVPVALFPWLTGAHAPGWVLAFAAAAILGHVYSFWIGFRGGKGVATSTGAFLALAPWAVLIGLLVWTGAVALTRYVSLGSVLAVLVLPVAVLLTPHRGGEPVVYFTLGLALFILWSHRENLARLRRGKENRFEVGETAHKGEG